MCVGVCVGARVLFLSVCFVLFLLRHGGRGDYQSSHMETEKRRGRTMRMTMMSVTHPLATRALASPTLPPARVLR